MKNKEKIYTYLLGLSVLLIFFASCKKDEILAYKNDPRIYFYERENDLVNTRITSKSFSFVTTPSNITQDTIFIKVRIMGNPSSTDRIFTAEALEEGTTAVQGTHYNILNGTIKATQTEGYLPVLLYRTNDLKTEEKQLELRIVQTNDFQTGVIEDQFFTLFWSDKLIKPENWTQYELAYFFGAYSETKHRFIIDVLGIAEFPLQPSRFFYTPGCYTADQLFDFRAQLKVALAEYNDTHDPDLTDEFGDLVTFP